MAKTTEGSRPAKTRAKTSAALVPASPKAGALVRVRQDGGKAVFRRGEVTMVAGEVHPIGGRAVVVDAAYYVGADAVGRAARLGNADKLAWRDAATGYECIMIRDPSDGFLRGFVGVEPGHPLYGFEHEAIPPDFDIEVHGGLTYSAICEEGPSPKPRLIREARSICHVRQAALHAPVVHATDHSPAHDAAWWFGFDCNHLYDQVPGRLGDCARFLAEETGTAFRDEAYVYDQIVDLAAQLRAIADGLPRPERTGAAPPPVGLDPSKAG